jgi:hypothetical protein
MHTKFWTRPAVGALILFAASGCYSHHPYGHGGYPGYYGTAPPGTMAPGTTMPGTVSPGGGPYLGTPGSFPPTYQAPSSNLQNFGSPTQQFQPPVQVNPVQGGQGNDPFYGGDHFTPNGGAAPGNQYVPEYNDPGTTSVPQSQPKTSQAPKSSQAPTTVGGSRTFEADADPFPKSGGSRTFEAESDPFPKSGGTSPALGHGPQFASLPAAAAIHDSAVAAIPTDDEQEFFPPTSLKPVSASYAVLDEPDRDGGIQAMSRPNPYDHDRKGFRWLRGVINFDEANQKWYVMYSANPAADDEFGGEIALADTASLDVLNNGEVVYVEGQIDPNTRDDSGKPCYRVDFLAQLVPKEK